MPTLKELLVELVGLVGLVGLDQGTVCSTQTGAKVVVGFSQAENQNPTNPTTTPRLETLT